VRGDATASIWFDRKPAEAGGSRGTYKHRMTYRITGLDPAPYKPLFGLSDAELARRGVIRMIVSKKPSFPCRVSLADREIGDTVLLLNHISNDVANPYRATHAIFVADAEQAKFVDEIPPVFEKRVLSLRGFDKDGMMTDAILAQPGEADAGIRNLFDNPKIEAIHAHNAARGCFSAKIERHR